MKHVVVSLASVVLFLGCKEPRTEVPPPPPAEAPLPGDVEAEAVVNEIVEAPSPAANVNPALVEKYLAYRQGVLARARKVLVAMSASAGSPSEEDARLAASVRAQKQRDDWAAQMRAVEEAVRKEKGLSREDVVAIGQVTAEVLSARQIWKMSGGDEAVVAAKAELEKLPAAERAAAQKRIETRAAGFAKMRDAEGARKRFGDAVVDAVLKHEDALLRVQREGSQLMSSVN